jgi:UDP-N-acetylglucosamine/UDP-N-acetylgalactosamine diphosphorylase
MLEQVVHSLGQEQLLLKIGHLSSEQKEALLEQLQKYDPALARAQKELVLHPLVHTSTGDAPWQSFEQSGNSEDRASGEELIRQGKVGCLIMAGGQGTRLGYDGPKGAVPVTQVSRKSLFQLFCERTKAAGDRAGCLLPLCIMTSPQNHARTLAFFEAHNYFGLQKGQVTFIEQEMLPLLDDNARWFLDERAKVVEGPDGNGHALHLFYKRGIWKQWKDSGVAWLQVIFVDNALADPFDPEFFGFTARTLAEVALKASLRRSPQEKMGALAMREGGRLKVIEYSEIPEDSAAQYLLSNMGMFCFSMECIHRLSQEILPLHLARKTAFVAGAQVLVWKCERFIFDLLDHVRSSTVLVCPRELVYAPLKNATGEKSLETVRQALFLRGVL